MKTLLKNGVLLDAIHDGTAADVLVEDGIITAVGPGLEAEDAQVVDLSGHTVLPGFWDAHVHVVLEDGPFSDKALRGWAKNGVTTVRDCAMLSAKTVPEYLAWLKSQDGPQYPEVLHTGKFIDEPGGYGSDLPAGHTIGLLVHSPEEAAEMVRQLHAQGCQGIKIPLDFNPPPFSDQPRSCGLNAAEVKAICDTARSLGMWVSCHVLNAKELRTLVDCGITDAGHTPKDPMPDDLIADMVAKGIPMVSTVIGPVIDPDAPPAGPADMGPPPPPPPPEVQKAMAEQKQAEQATCLDNLRRFREAGGQVLLGTDLMFSGNYEMCACIPVLEMEALYQQGFGVQELVVAGTLAPAQASGVADRLGTLEVGKQANIIATARPIDGTFRALMAPEFVMNRGEILASAQ